MATALSTLGVTDLIVSNSVPLMGMVNRYDATGGNRTPVLPPLSGEDPGATTVIEKYDTSANTVTAVRNGVDTFDNGATSTTPLTARGRTQLQVVQILGIKYWKEMGTSGGGGGGGGGGTGDLSSNTTVSVDSELMLFNGTTGKSSKRAAGTGIVKSTSGVFSTVAAPAGPLVGTTDAQVLTTKTIDLATNTLIATAPQLNAAVSGIEFVGGSVNGVLTPLTLWTGTQAQYNAITTPDPNTVYVITDAGQRIIVPTGTSTPSYNTDNADTIDFTATVNIASWTTGRLGTLQNGQDLSYRIFDAGTHTIAWGSDFRAGGISPLPTSTVAGKTVTAGFKFDSRVSQLVCLYVDATGY